MCVSVWRGAVYSVLCSLCLRILINSWLPATHNGISDRIVQFPIRLYYAVSVHRSQDQTLSRVMLDVRLILSYTGVCVLLCRGYVTLEIS